MRTQYREIEAVSSFFNEKPSLAVTHLANYRLLLSFSLLLLTGHPLLSQTGNFQSHPIVPSVLRDPNLLLTPDSLLLPAVNARFVQENSPFFNIGNDPANWWLHFDIQNATKEQQPVVLRLNRKNFDEFDLYFQPREGAPLEFIGQVGARQSDTRFMLTNGYHFNLNLEPGNNHYYAMACNRIGSMHLSLSALNLEDFQEITRKQMLLFGLFLGVMLISILFAVMLQRRHRDNYVYLLYLIYLFNILLREAYNYSADFGILPVFQRNVTSILIATSFGLFFRQFIQLKQLAPRIDQLVKWYAVLIGLVAIAVGVLAYFNCGNVLQYVFRITDATNLIFTFLALVISLAFSRKSVYARVTAIAFVPLGIGFVAILLRNMNLVPNYPIITQAVMIGFIFEVAVFTIAFLFWHRIIENEWEMLQLKLINKEQEKQLAVQAAEHRVKDRIARDLHDDLAASMSSIRILSQVVRTQFGKKAPEAVPILEQISQSSQDTAESISDLIWAVKPGGDYLNNMADRIRDTSAKLLEAKNIHYQFDIARDLPLLELDLEKRRNLYLIFKEALNNAVKYSQCTKVDISLSCHNGQVTLVVADNGIGFDPTQLLGNGNGLSNMQKRAADIGAQIKIDAQPQKGVRIELVC